VVLLPSLVVEVVHGGSMYGRDQDQSATSDGHARTIEATLVSSLYRDAAVLANEHLSATVLPSLGGGLARLDWMGRREPHPLLRPTALRDDAGTGDLSAHLVLQCTDASCDSAPSSDAVSLVAPEPYCSEWEIEGAGARELELVLDRTDSGRPFFARQSICLTGASLSISLEVENTGTRPMSLCTGMHAHVFRASGAHLAAPANFICADANGSSSAQWWEAPLAWQMSVAYPLPARRVRNLFLGWSGTANIISPAESLELIISSESQCYLLDTPAGKNYFTFFPHDRPDLAATSAEELPDVGATIIAPGERAIKVFSLSVKRT
jgi:aldose 1-epimerase